MDVEKTIQFLVEIAAHHDAQLVEIKNSLLSIEASVLMIGNGLITLTSVVQTLAEGVQEYERTAREETERLRQETYRLDAESRERGRLLDERIDRLLRGIANGRGNPPPGQV